MTLKEFARKLTECMNNGGLSISTNEIKFDGDYSRCGTKRKPKSKNGSYKVIVIKDKYFAWWRDWSTGNDGAFFSKNPDKLKGKAKNAYTQALKEYLSEQAQEEAERIENGIKQSNKFWSDSEDVCGKAHSYLKKKQVISYGLRESVSGKLLIPAYNQDGVMQNIQRIFKAGDKYEKWFLPCPTKGLYFPIPAKQGKEKEALLIAEGYATGASLHEATTYEVYIAFSAMNLPEIAKFARKKFPTRPIVICADYDNPNQTYPEEGGTGLAWAKKAASSIGYAYIAEPLHPNGEKNDFNDMACKVGLQEVDDTIKTVLNANPYNACAIPEGYKLIKAEDKAGLYRTVDGENIFLGSPLEVTAEACNSESTGWAKIVEFKDRAGTDHSVSIPYSELDRNWQAILADNGWICEAKPYYVQEFLKKSNPQFRKQLVEQIGWQKESCFIFPEMSYGETSDISYHVNIKDAHKYFTTHGSLKDWQEIAKLCKGNPFMKFGLAAAFVGPILPLVKMDNVGFIFEGLTSIGKTTILRFAASVFGNPEGFVNSWRATDNAMEDIAYLYNNTLLVLDELSMSNPELLGSIIYMLGNGQGKARADQYGLAKTVKRWKEAILCSGEIGVSAMLEEAGKRKLGGQEVRMSGFYLPNDHIKNLHNREDVKGFLGFINRSCLENYGLAGRDFISKLVVHKDSLNLSKDLLETIDKTAAMICPSDADAQMTRVAKNMSLVACAGKLAAKLGTLPMTFAKLGYVKTCFENWLKNRNLEIRYTEEDIIQQIKRTLISNRTKHFHDIRSKQDFTGELWGYTGLAKSGCQETDYIMARETFERLFCKGHNAKQIAKMLKKRGMLRFDIDADGIERTNKKVTFGEFKQKRMMVINLTQE